MCSVVLPVLLAEKRQGGLHVANLVLVVVAGLSNTATDLTLGEAVRDFGALRQGLRRVAHDLGADGRLVGDRVIERTVP